MRAITPLGRTLLVVMVAALVGLIVGSAGLQIAALILLVLAPAWGVWACVNSGQGMARLYDPERRRRPPSDTGASPMQWTEARRRAARRPPRTPERTCSRPGAEPRRSEPGFDLQPNPAA